MNIKLFQFPQKAEFGRVVPKSKIYEHARPTRSVRQRFVDEVSQIVWQYKLSPETINLPARKAVPEIQVFGITLKSEELSESVLRAIDKAIPFPILFELTSVGSKQQERINTVMAYKRPSDAETSGWVVDAYFESGWQSASTARQPLPVASHLGGLYEQLLRTLITLPAREGESLRKQVERIAAIRSKESQRKKLEQQLKREPQFNRKVELNGQLRRLKDKLDSLRR